MSEIMKHVGMIANTNKKIVVVFNQIPDREDHSLVVDMEALPERIHDPIESVLKSSEGQQAHDLGHVLSRRYFPDTTEIILQHLHEAARLQAVPLESVIMLPRPNSPVPLKDILIHANKYVEKTDPDTQTMSPEEVAEKFDKFNQHALNQQIDTNTDAVERAQNLLIEADMLQEEVNAKRQQAYRLNPSLSPDTVVSETTVEQTTELSEAVEPNGDVDE